MGRPPGRPATIAALGPRLIPDGPAQGAGRTGGDGGTGPVGVTVSVSRSHSSGGRLAIMLLSRLTRRVRRPRRTERHRTTTASATRITTATSPRSTKVPWWLTSAATVWSSRPEGRGRVSAPARRG